MAELTFADTAGPDLDDIGYEWRREQLLEETDDVCVITAGIWCDMGAACANGPRGHWWQDTCRTPDERGAVA